MGDFTACLCRSCGLGEAPDARDFPSSLYSEASPREIKSQSAELPAKKMSNSYLFCAKILIDALVVIFGISGVYFLP